MDARDDFSFYGHRDEEWCWYALLQDIRLGKMQLDFYQTCGSSTSGMKWCSGVLKNARLISYPVSIAVFLQHCRCEAVWKTGTGFECIAHVFFWCVVFSSDSAISRQPARWLQTALMTLVIFGTLRNLKVCSRKLWRVYMYKSMAVMVEQVSLYSVVVDKGLLQIKNAFHLIDGYANFQLFLLPCLNVQNLLSLKLDIALGNIQNADDCTALVNLGTQWLLYSQSRMSPRL